MRFRCLVLLSVVVSLAFAAGHQTASAGNLTLIADSVVWDPADGPLSPPMTLALLNDTDPDTERLQGWMVRLEVVPDALATGTLSFSSRNLPGSDYILEGDSGGLGGSLSATSLFAFDDALSFVGSVVPTSGSRLLEVRFSTPDNAMGTFHIVAVPGLGMTGWSDDSFNDREFVNVPFAAGQPLVLGEVLVVPEPAGLMLALQILVAIGVVGILRRQRTRERSGM